MDKVAPYLPYGVKIINEKWQHVILEVEHLETSKDGNFRYWFRPYLRPLSELVKDEPDGESLLDELRFSSELNWCDAYDEFLNCFDIDNPEYMSTAPYEIVIWLLKNHFDIFDLIDKGLAIDINALEK